jgi:renalase
MSPAVEHDTVVIGAGMAGLTAARRLAAAGLDVLVVDKGRAVGGRMATRRFAGGRFDHGAQHFSARSVAFQEAVAGWRSEGVVEVWFNARSITQPERGVEPRHASVGAMRALPEYLAEGLALRTELPVDRLEAGDGGVAVVSGGVQVMARSAILTAPLPQSLGLLDASNVHLAASDRAALGTVQYDATLAVLATLVSAPNLRDGHCAIAEGPIAWVADNHHKGVSSIPAVTIHSSAEFAARHLEAEQDRWVGELATVAEELLGATVVSAHGHRWRYAQPRTAFDTGCVAAKVRVPIVLAGEVFAGAKVEGAFLSGQAAADEVLARLS